MLGQDNLAIQQNKTKLKIDKAALTFPESNLMHSMNGFVYCNGPSLQLKAGERVRWLVMGFGSEADMHSPVFDGQAVEYAGEVADPHRDHRLQPGPTHTSATLLFRLCSI